MRLDGRYRMKADTIVHVMNNGHSFVIEGAENEIVIYNKSEHSEKYIQEYFLNNGLSNCEVNRIESRLTWNYIRYLRNKKALDINVETLLDPRKLANIFKVSTNNKITFKDTSSTTFDNNRNKKYQTISIIDDLNIETAEIGVLNPEIRISHYKNKTVDENIMRQNYFLFLETGNRKYFKNFIASSRVAGYRKSQLINFLNKLNIRYNGNHSQEIHERMEFAVSSTAGTIAYRINRLFHSMMSNLKSVMLGVF